MKTTTISSTNLNSLAERELQNSAKNGKVMLNLGCGQNRPLGWINTDSSLNSLIQNISLIRNILANHTDKTIYNSANSRYMDLRKSWDFPSGSVDVVYASHVFEHLSLSSSQIFLQEAYRVLKSGSVIRIVVPDLYQLAKEYISSYEKKKENSSQIFLNYINMHQENTYGHQQGLFSKILHLWQGYPHQHKYMYDRFSLQKSLGDFGFTNLHESTYSHSKYIPEIKDVEATKEGVYSIYIEGQKL